MLGDEEECGALTKKMRTWLVLYFMAVFASTGYFYKYDCADPSTPNDTPRGLCAGLMALALPITGPMSFSVQLWTNGLPFSLSIKPKD